MEIQHLSNRIKTILKDIKAARLTDKAYVEEFRMKQCNYNQREVIMEDSDHWDGYKSGEAWGGRDVHFCFKATVTIPDSSAGKSIVCKVETGAKDIWNYDNPQFLAYVNGELICGLDVNHTEFDLSKNAVGGETFELALYAYCSTELKNVFMNVYVAVVQQEVADFYYDLEVPFEVAELLLEDDLNRLKIMAYLNHAINLLDLRKIGNQAFYDSVKAADAYLQKEFYETYCGTYDIIEHCIGHTHIDVAWLWSLDQTREKVIRSFASVLYLMEKYPEYKFMSSQPQLYEFVKHDSPVLYGKIKERIAEGRWEAEGAMWLEADCNLTSGESLVRQILYGKRFFKNEFGVDNKVLWLPDVFGYSAAMPQIMKKSGIDYFMTTKIAWNDTNKIPNDTLLWKGIDGSEVLTHFITTTNYDKYPELKPKPSHETTYNGILDAKQVKGCWQRYQNKAINNEILQCYGYGDGGGGPTAEMLENARRLAKAIPSVPIVKQTFVRDYFERLDEKLKKCKDMPTWVGELYLEFHRGTYTSMARNKRYNRLCEFKNTDAELFFCMNRMSQGVVQYPAEELSHCWKLTMLNQFHDILPGTSIKKVYDDSQQQYEEILGLSGKLIDTALEGIAVMIASEGDAVVVFNQLGFMRTDLVEFSLENTKVAVQDGEDILPTQCSADGKLMFVARNIPAKGYKTFKIIECDGAVSQLTMKMDAKRVVTPFYDILLNDNGEFTSILDKLENREVLAAGERGNVLQVFEDKPFDYEAWNIELYYQEKMWEINQLAELEVIENGPVRGCLRVKRYFMDSVIDQVITFYHHSKRIDFNTTVDWKEEHLLLKVAFPVDIMSNKATYEIQYGNVERNTHWNTSWDMAKFEVCAHKWADLSENGYGVALMNNCKYGYDIKDSVMRLSLIKSATYPNPDADKEIHHFTYAIYPHNGDFRAGQVVQTAYELNCPFYAKTIGTQAGSLPAENSYVSVDKENVIIEVLKKAEDSSNIIVRLYEAYGRRTSTTLRMVQNTVAFVYACDLLENRISELSMVSDSVNFEIKPYEIISIMLKLN